MEAFFRVSGGRKYTPELKKEDIKTKEDLWNWAFKRHTESGDNIVMVDEAYFERSDEDCSSVAWYKGEGLYDFTHNSPEPVLIRGEKNYNDGQGNQIAFI